MKILKRAGNFVIYDDEKVVRSILRANEGTGEALTQRQAEYLADAVLGKLVRSNPLVSTEMIRDGIYDALVDRNLWLTARAYKDFKKEAN